MIQRTDTDARVGANIKALRLARGWSQPELGRRMGVAATTVSNFETGARPITDDALRRLALALETTTAVLAGGGLPADQLSRMRAEHANRRSWKHNDRAGLHSPDALDVPGATISVERTKRGELRIAATLHAGYDAIVARNAVSEISIRALRIGFAKEIAREVSATGAVVDEEDEAA